MRFRFHVPILATLLALTLVACAGNNQPAQPGTLAQKELALAAAEHGQTLLIRAQDSERALCNRVAFAAAPDQPVKECTGPAAEAARLTTARHQAINARFVTAYELHKKAVGALKMWQPGQPLPPEVTGWEVEVRAALAVVRELSASESVSTLASLVNQVIEQIANVRAALQR